MHNILYLCTGNSARSIIAEMVTNHYYAGEFTAYSAGSFPKGKVHPASLSLLRRMGVSTQGAASKSWDAFVGESSPRIDIVITVCDNAAGETCPAFPGKQLRAHWGIADPAAVEGSGQEEAFRLAYDRLKARIDAMAALDLSVDPEHVQQQLAVIGEMQGATHLT